MHAALVVIHVLVGFALILIVLLQTGKGASIGAVFGGSSQTLFGSRGAGTFLGKMTSIAAIIFMLTSLSLAMLSARRGTGSLLESQPIQQESTAVPASAGADVPEAAPANLPNDQ